MAKGRYGLTKGVTFTPDDLTVSGGDLIGSDSGADTKITLIESRAILVVDGVSKVDCQPSLVSVDGDLTSTGRITALDPLTDAHLVTKGWAVANLASSGQGGSNVATRTVGQADSPVTVATSDFMIFADPSSGALTINLPSPTGLDGKRFVVKRTAGGSNSVSIVGAIDGGASLNLSEPYAAVSLICNGSEYFIW
tara:strand:- start:14572 stop:15156 length:585 start_codon:yes stop_codon:yes gene_type:complete